MGNESREGLHFAQGNSSYQLVIQLPDRETLAGFTKIGRLGKSHGSNGELRIALSNELPEPVPGDFLFINLNGSKVPYEVDSVRNAKGLVLTFRNINDPTAASRLAGREVYLPADTAPSTESVSDELTYAYVRGFRMIDSAAGEIGFIVSVDAFPQQEMARLQLGNREVLVPLNETYIVNIDRDEEVVEVSLPEGILDL